MKKLLFGFFLVIVILIISGCPGVYFIDPFDIDDQQVVEGETLILDLKDYTRARNMEELMYEILDEDAPWEITDGHIFRFENVPFENSPFEVNVSVTNDKGRTVSDFFVIYVCRLFVLIMENPEGEGTVVPAVGEHSYVEGTEVDIEATADKGWEFDRWQVNGADYSTERKTSVTVEGDLTVKALFEKLPPEKYTLTMLEPAGDGVVVPAVGEHSYVEGTEVNIEATPDKGWVFVRWETDGVEYSTERNTTLIVDSDRTIRAFFEEDLVKYKLVVLQPVGEGTVNPSVGEHKYIEGTEALLTAAPDTGWLFDQWETDGLFLSDEPTATLIMDRDIEVQAFFSAKHYTIQALVEPEGSGFIKGVSVFEKVFTHGEQVQLEAQPAEGFRFVEWSGDIDGIDKSKQEISFDADGDRKLVAHFELREYTVTVIADPEEAGEVNGEGNYHHGDLVKLTATPLDGWVFVEWNINDEIFEEPGIEFEIEEDIIAVVLFREDMRPMVSIDSLPYSGVEVKINGEVFETPIEVRVSEGSMNQMIVEEVQELNLRDWPRGIDTILKFYEWDDGFEEHERVIVANEDSSFTLFFEARYRVVSATFPGGVEDPGNTGWHDHGSKLVFEVPLETTAVIGGEEKTIEFRYWRINREYDLQGEAKDGKAILELEIIGPTFVQARYHLPCSD